MSLGEKERQISIGNPRVGRPRAWGLRARRHPLGRKIKKYGGEVIGDKKAAKRLKRGAAAIMKIGKGLNIDGFREGNGAAFINHSRKTPNCFLLREKRRIWIVSGIEGIKAGEELTFDYGSDYYPRTRRRRS